MTSLFWVDSVLIVISGDIFSCQLILYSILRRRYNSRFLKMSGMSNVGGPGVYEAGDQRTSKDSDKPQADRYHEGKENSHKANDPSMSSLTHGGKK